MTVAYLGLGANLGRRRENLRTALRRLPPACAVIAVSALYESRAVVLEGQPAGPDYYNAACAIETALAPEALLAYVKRIERDAGRRPAGRWEARVIDIDILLYGDAIIDTPDLTVPHALLAERNFVLAPLSDIAPGVVHPVLGKTIEELAGGAGREGLRRVGEWDAAAGDWRAEAAAS